MKISRHEDDARQSVKRAETFTGDVWGEPVLQGVDGIAMNSVWFAPGARTYWHRHGGGQILHVTNGQGKVRSRGGEEVTIGAGDTIWTPPGEEHYHGAEADRFLVHLAISYGTTEWLEEVTDEQAK